MGIVQNLSLLAMRPVVGGAGQVLENRAPGERPRALAGLLETSFVELGPHLTSALQTAADHAWRAVEIALAGNSGQTPNAVQAFLQSDPLAGSAAAGPAFRAECTRELQAARKAGALAEGALDLRSLARQAAVWAQADDPTEQHDTERGVLEQLAEEVRRANCQQLSRLVELQARQEPSLIAAAMRASFHRLAERDDSLRGRLPWAATDGAAPDAWGLPALTELLAAQGSPRDGEAAEARVAAAPPTEQGPPAAKEQGPLGPELLRALKAHHLEERELQPGDMLKVADEVERQWLRKLCQRARGLPEAQQHDPALRNMLGKLAALVGDFDSAYLDFDFTAHRAPDFAAQAEAWASAYQVALERREFPRALAALKHAAARDPERYAPFPLSKYEPESIARVDGFSVGFLCKHRNTGSFVVVNALRPDVLDREIGEIFQQVQLLDMLEFPAIVRLRDCDFADGAQGRPFLVRDHFDGLPLSDYMAQHGPLGTADLLAIFRPIAEALEAAHARGISHRGVHPGCLLVRKDPAGWRVKLVNFGLSLKRNAIRGVLENPAARAGTTLGAAVNYALEFAAPEQLGRLEGASTGPASDVYSFGRTCYFALLRTAEPDDQEKEQLGPAWRKLLGRCTAWNVARRPAGFTVVLEAMNAPAPAAPPKLEKVEREPAAPPPTAPAAPPVVTPSPPSAAEEAAACVQRGIALRQKGDTDQAITEFSRALQLDPRNATALQGRGNAYATKGDYDRAIAEYTESLAIDPRAPQTYINRGLAYVKKKDTAKAIADYSRALRLDPQLALAYLNRGSAYARQGEFDRAVADFNEALKLDGQLALAYVNRGLAFSKKGDLDRAIADYNKALEIQPGNREAKARRNEALRNRQSQAKPAVQPAAAPPPAATAPPAAVAPAAPASRRPAAAPQPTAPAGKNAPRSPAAAAETPPPKKPVPSTTESQVLDGHADAVRCGAFSLDGRRIISGSEDKTLRLWDAKTGKKLTRYVGHTGGITSAVFSPNGDKVLSGSQDHTVRLWSVETGEELRRFGGGRFFGGSGHTDAVVSVAFSPDGTQAISASWDKTVRLWDVESGRELRALTGHNWLIHSVAFSPDGKHAIYGSEDQTVRLWDVGTGQEVRRFAGHDGWVLSVAFSPDGRQVLSGSSDGTLRLWSVARGKEMRRFGGQKGLMQCVAYSPDGKYALSGEYTLPGENTLMRLWDIESGLELARFTGHAKLIWSVAFSPDGRYALSASADQTLRLWKLPKQG